jgi:hypothetical protein
MTSQRAEGGDSMARKKTNDNARATRQRMVSTKVRDRARLAEGMDSSTRLRLFLQSSALDFVLVLVVAVTMTMTISYGFHSAWAYRGNPLFVGAICLPMLLAMYVGMWSKKTIVPSVIASVVVALLIIGIAIVVSPPGGEMVSMENSDIFVFDDGSIQSSGYALNDVEANYGIFAIIAVLCSVVTFLFSRKMGLLPVLLVLVIGSCGIIQYLYRDWIISQPGIPIAMIALVALGMLFVYFNYRQSIYTASRARKVSFGGAFAFSGVLALICVLAGVGVFYGIVSVAGLTTPDYRPIEEIKSPPTIDVDDDYQYIPLEGDGTSNNTNDDEENSTGEGEGSDTSGSSGAGSAIDALAKAVATIAGFDAFNLDDEEWEAIRYDFTNWAILIACLLVLLLIVLLVCLQRARRKLRLKRIEKRSGSYQVWYLYQFLIKRFRRLKIRKPDHMTPLEFATSFSTTMRSFTRGTSTAGVKSKSTAILPEVDFVDVSEIYQDVAFGGLEPTPEDLDVVKRYYLAFFKNARIYVKWPKWLLYKFWRI